MFTSGQEVTIKRGLKKRFIRNIFVNSEMVELGGSTQVVNFTDPVNNRVFLVDNPYTWPLEAFAEGPEDAFLCEGCYVRIEFDEEIRESFSTGFVSSMSKMKGKIFKVKTINNKDGNADAVTLDGAPFFWDPRALKVLKQSEVDTAKDGFKKVFGQNSLFRMFLDTEAKKICTVIESEDGRVNISTCFDGKKVRDYISIFAFLDDIDNLKPVCVENNSSK